MERKNKSNRDEYSKKYKNNSNSSTKSSKSNYRKRDDDDKANVKRRFSDDKSDNNKGKKFYKKREGDDNYNDRKPFTKRNDYDAEKKPYEKSKDKPSYFESRKSYKGRDDRKKLYGNKEKSYSKHDNRKSFEKKSEDRKPVAKKINLDDKSIRLNRFIASAGICSRREADNYIKSGVIKVNGEVITDFGTKVQPNDKVTFNDQIIKSQNLKYVLLNKPKDFITTLDDPHAKKKITDLVKNCCRERIYPVGRLDRYTTGVLLLTNDGELTKKLTHPKYNRKKIYEVTLDKRVTKADMLKILSGIELEDGMVNADELAYVDAENKKVVGIELHSGKNRIVRRIFESLGYKVNKLDRVYFAGLTKKGLARGKWKFLTEKEVAFLKMGGNL